MRARVDVAAVEEIVTLRDGSRALVRPIRPDDRWRIAAGLKLLSPRTRYLRFHADLDEFSDEQLTYLTEVDHHDHEAWVALDADDPDAPGMGVARYVRLADEPEVAEVAVTVVDAYQGRGLGTILLRRLAASAIEHGVRRFRNYVLADNEPMLEVLDLVGASRREIEPGLLQVEVELPDDPELLPGPGLSQLFREAARGLLPPVLWQPFWSPRWREDVREWLRQVTSRRGGHGDEVPPPPEGNGGTDPGPG
jgi:RimJ/RimL family protein N-acetyltransferase